ncbi:e62a7027-20c5-45de-9890-802a0de5c1fa [Sclerotinia trifoliorum]|uniref:E62a7027-20c5-45de-9890-802a0de5c1fa n=1 Tax=Sclerotinia trifoliorum TaxID=28548 RepID=A0A8H2ZJT7_9HELO|nr:e62a7027-20c5-45de-9890-802a0de5c1fa [Sclerotinia trifoliorum]
MKFSSISIVSSLLALGSAQLDIETTPVVSSGASPSIVTETITVTEGGSSGYQTDPIYPTTTAGYPMSSEYITTAQGTVTSVKYDGESQSTVWVYPTGTGNKKHCTVATYENNIVIDVNIVDITIIIIDGFLFTETVTLTESATYTPTPPPMQSTTTAPYSTGTGTDKPNAKIHNVTIGDKGLNIYSPNQINANIGDTIRFQFLAKNHTVTQSDFNTPCTPNGGFDTGFIQFNPNNQSDITRDFIVNTDKPIWFFCAQTVPKSHCQGGMVLGINPAGKFDAFLEKAKESNVTGGNVTGGNFTTAPVPTETGAGYVSGVAAPTSSRDAVDSSYGYSSVRGRAFRA